MFKIKCSDQEIKQFYDLICRYSSPWRCREETLGHGEILIEEYTFFPKGVIIVEFIEDTKINIVVLGMGSFFN
jgi:hypothetical protein